MLLTIFWIWSLSIQIILIIIIINVLTYVVYLILNMKSFQFNHIHYHYFLTHLRPTFFFCFPRNIKKKLFWCFQDYGKETLILSQIVFISQAYFLHFSSKEKLHYYIISLLVSTKRSHVLKQTCNWKYLFKYP